MLKLDGEMCKSLADRAEALAKRFDAFTPSGLSEFVGQPVEMKDADEKYWTYKGSSPTPTVAQLPAGAFKGTQEDFSTLSPGMRREIQRQAEREAAKLKHK
jgi:hypothetical protein